MLFSTLVEEVKQLSLAQKEELDFLLHQYLIAERRQLIAAHFEASRKEQETNQLSFSEDIDKLKNLLES